MEDSIQFRNMKKLESIIVDRYLLSVRNWGSPRKPHQRLL